MIKSLPANAGDMGSIPCRRKWHSIILAGESQAIVHGAAKESDTT